MTMKALILLLFIFFNQALFSQDLTLEGTLSGYYYNPTKGLFKKKSDILLEGRLANADIKFLERGEVVKQTSTNKNGEFQVKIPVGSWYKVQISKKKYETIIFDLDLTHAKNDVTLNTLELILNQYVPKRSKSITSFGILGYNSRGFYFKASDNNSKYVDYTPLISLIKESIQKNSNEIANSNTSNQGTSTHQQFDNTLSDSSTFFKDSLNVIKNSYLYSKLVSKEPLTESDIKQKEESILEARKQLEIDKKNAKTELDYLLIKEREQLIESAENEVKHLKETIKQKEKLIQLKNTQLWLFIGLLILVIGLLLLFLKFNNDKSKLNKALKENHKKIEDSITYAEKIQTAILPPIKELSNLLPNSFVLFKPKDVVSGDFYWFDKVDDKIIIAAIDCTGHGVPGAFMSMMGNVILNNIILEQKIVSPKEILNQLNIELQKALNQNENDPFSGLDGMDMSLCVIDVKQKTMTYAGAMNPIFVVRNGEIETLEVTKRGIGGYDIYGAGEFKEFTRTINSDEKYYLLTDGFKDQFGGGNKEKFNLKRFKELLIQSEIVEMRNQKDIFNKTLEDWQMNNDQTDDILVIGFSF